MSERSPANMDTDFQERQNDYSPDGSVLRIKDSDKAQVMADRSDFFETQAAAIRYAADVALQGSSDSEEFAKEFNHTIRRGDELPKQYSYAIETAPPGDIENIEGLAEELQYLRNEADKNATFAGEVYDILKSSKR